MICGNLDAVIENLFPTRVGKTSRLSVKSKTLTHKINALQIKLSRLITWLASLLSHLLGEISGLFCRWFHRINCTIKQLKCRDLSPAVYSVELFTWQTISKFPQFDSFKVIGLKNHSKSS